MGKFRYKIDVMNEFRKPVALAVLGQNTHPQEPVRHTEYEILFVYEGTATLCVENNDFDIHSGDVVFIDSFENHYLKVWSKEPELKLCRMFFSSDAFGTDEDECKNFFLSVKFCRFLKISEELKKRILETAQNHQSETFLALTSRALLFEIIASAVENNQYERFSQLSVSEKRSVSAIENSLQFIKENYSENISLSSLLLFTNYSKSHFIKLFKESTGMSFSEYINKYRIEKSCLDLLYTDKNITEIATSNGFNNIQYFSRRFKECMNCTPKQYQKKRKKLISRV